MVAEEGDGRTVKLRGVRLSFTDSLTEKKATSAENPDRKTHHLNIIIEADGPYGKHSKENRDKVMSAIRAACKAKWKREDKWQQIQEDSPKRICYRKGEKWRNKDGQVYAGYEGNHAFSASGPGGGQRRPQFIDRYKRVVLPRGETPPKTKREIRHIEVSEIDNIFYSGCYADVTVSFYGTDKGSDGVFATCELIRSYQEGERVAGGYRYDDEDLDDFDDFDDDDDDLDAPAKPGSRSAIDDDDI